ncbi:ATPase V [Enterococcus cecorum]|uniref:ATPase V n=1 Tax=Enterococcus cecorum TaxID=44008 RepID=UPI00148E784C|nr:ATPase V [Enterococcus cecorum]
MSAIENIIEQIESQARSEREAFEKKELARLDEVYQQKFNLLAQDKERQLKKQAQMLDKKYKQLHNRQEVEARQTILNEKQRYLEHLFVQAAEEMAAWSPEQMQDFAQQALASLDLNHEVQFISGEYSKKAYSADFIAKLNAQLPFSLQLADKIINKQAGFIIDDGGVQYNFIFENLIKDIQTTMSFDLAKQLFD